MLVHVTSFFNTIIESPSSYIKRMDLKEDLLQHGVTMAMSDVRIKIRDRAYLLDNCTYETVMRGSVCGEIEILENEIPNEGGKLTYLSLD